MTAIPYPEKLHNSSVPRIKDSVNIIEMGDNYQQRIEVGLNPQHEEWSILWPLLTASEFSSVISTLATVRCVLPLTWTSPIDGVSKKYVVVPDSRQMIPLGKGRWSVSLSLRQVFDL
jgi:Phage minor tail protein.